MKFLKGQVAFLQSALPACASRVTRTELAYHKACKRCAESSARTGRGRENGTYLYAIIIKGKENSIPQGPQANGRGAFCLHILRMSACTGAVPFALVSRLVAGMRATCSFGADCVAFMQAKN